MRANSTPDAFFLTPPHSHDPNDVSHVAALPSSMMMQLPEAVQDALWNLQESTSIVYASYMRLQDLVHERFDRLRPLPGQSATGSTSYSEGAFFNYVNHVAAERRYLLEDAHPDWKHKASRAGIHQYGDLVIDFRGKQMTVAEWFSQLKAAEAFWIQEAAQTELPDFESTVLEYRSLSSTPTSETSDASEGLIGMPVPTGRKAVDAEGLGLEFRMAKALEAL
ncbi:hypothetical protein A1O1_04059 [Capronia coronata CBS 617.96]|uniref:Uncharacterized protein n=1 Tax=Capronia coronata CBS 617.96 TaxID=1182541 RepID=W9YDK8_9EURO|nr:uncharacterized protein A1O1_04059 [Capronia coronata CBS 617.96]EXJ90952.1 hypothetical protein A1O1_04059 [Capronia coronata CBS 617.96]